MRLNVVLISLFEAALIFAIPNLGRRGMLFAVPVAPEFRRSETARRSVAAFRLLIGAVTLAGILIALLSSEPVLEILTVTLPAAILAASAAGFARQHRTLSRFAVQPSNQTREADLTSVPDRLPRFTWAAAGPFALLAGAAFLLRDNWSKLPEKFPTHWGFDGQPNAWSTRTPHGVYAPLLFGAELSVWLTILALACWFGARRSRSRRTMLGILVAAQYMLAAVFALIAVQPLYSLPLWVIVPVPFAFIVCVLVVLARRSADPGEPIEPTPNSCWKAGLIYYNPADAALFVEKRTGLGYTVNFGNRWSWALMLALMLIVGSVWLV